MASNPFADAGPNLFTSKIPASKARQALSFSSKINLEELNYSYRKLSSTT
jgi:hypothetical protein